MKILAILILGLAVNVSAQYQIDWFTTDGGGGFSSGGAYTVTGTIGQSDAGVSSGGAYKLQGGFWNGFELMEVGPALRIFYAGEKVILAWPDPSTGFQLQLSPSLATPAWTNVNEPPSVVSGEKQFIQPLESGARFYRLRKP